MFFALSDGQAVPRRHDVEETILFSLALSFHSYPGLSGLRALPLQAGGEGKGSDLEEAPPHYCSYFRFIFDTIWLQHGIQEMIEKSI